MLAILGPRINRVPVIPRRLIARRAEGRPGIWTWLSHSIMRRPWRYLLATGGVLLALALTGLGMHLTGGDNRGVPKTTEATRGLALLESTLGAGTLAPHQIVIDTGRAGGAFSAPAVAAEQRLVASLRSDPDLVARTVQAPALLVPRPGRPDAATMAQLERRSLVDPTGRVIQVRVAGRTDSGTAEAQRLVHRLRDRYVPAAGFTRAQVYVTGAPAFGVDFTQKAYSAFPWLVVGVLLISYLLLMRAFRSVVLPAKAVLMNLLSVGATYGVLVLVFQHGWGTVVGLESLPQVQSWIPVFLFAMLFGLSMDYEVFLLSRMREEWDAGRDNESAVAHGLERTGRIITAAAIIMIAAFSGFMAGSFVGLQQFGVGLAVAIFLDATLVRAILVPAAMKLLGHWNWYLPERIRRALRLRPAPRMAAAPAAGRSRAG
jgi:RND superfamily putative drug exporter